MPDQGSGLCSKKRLIIDTDLLSFDDDPLAIGLSGENSRYVPPAIDAINTFFGYPQIPVAIQKPVNNLTRRPGSPEFGPYVVGLAYNFTEDIRDGNNTPDPDNSITLAVIGYFDNVFNLLNSSPDQISPYTGAELLASKVRELVVQANDVGYSFNTNMHNETFAEKVLNWWPGKLTFAWDGVGENTVLGERITTELDTATNPLGYALRANIGYGQKFSVWDATAVYYAVCGLDDVFRWKYPHGGRVRVNASAFATWENGTASSPRLQNSLEFKVPNTTFAARLENTLLWEPGQRIPYRRTWCKN
ncbi:hypothetical protein Daesc_006983 [Daldinia eschscholtzii]|uniref:Uncharacterized protein n=1 Tax=Daldinia eschscholtzii TaxID=292717 RepID=A0AAX6MIZ7_9PEZI